MSSKKNKRIQKRGMKMKEVRKEKILMRQLYKRQTIHTNIDSIMRELSLCRAFSLYTFAFNQKDLFFSFYFFDIISSFRRFFISLQMIFDDSNERIGIF